MNLTGYGMFAFWVGVISIGLLLLSVAFIWLGRFSGMLNFTAFRIISGALALLAVLIGTDVRRR